MEEATELVDQWVALPQVKLIQPGTNFWPVFRRMLIDGAVRGRLTSDAALAALTIEHAGVLHTNDRDFARFPGLRWVNPLQES